MNICKLFKQTILLESKAVCFFRKFPAEGSEKIEEAENERPGKLRGSASSGGSTEGGQPFVPGCRDGSALLGSRGNAHWRVLPATLHTGLLPDAKAQQNAASLPFPLWGKS